MTKDHEVMLHITVAINLHINEKTNLKWETDVKDPENNQTTLCRLVFTTAK